MGDGSSRPILHVPWYRTRWFKWLLGGVVLVAVIAGAAIGIFFTMWWNGPEKALLDATNYTLENDGQYNVVSKQTNLTVLVGNSKYAVDGTYAGLQFNAVLYGGFLYVKSPDPARLYQLLMASGSSQLPPAVQAIADSVRNRWISVNLDTITLQAPAAQNAQCVIEEKDSIAADPNARSQWRSAYFAHRFFAMQTTKNADSTSIDISVNTKTRQDFFAALLKTSFYQSLKDCSQKEDILSSIKATSPLAHVTLTPAHVFESIIVDPHGSSPVTITASYRNVPQIVVPTDATSLDQLALGILGPFNGLQ